MTKQELEINLEEEKDHSAFLEKLLHTLYGDGWSKITIFDAKEWHKKHFTPRAKVRQDSVDSPEEYHEKIKERLAPVVAYTEKETGYLIYLKGEQDGRLVTGTVEMDGRTLKVAYVYFKNCTEAIHELGHLLATPGPRPVSLISQLLRELEAWRCAEYLHDRFGVRFDTQTFDEGLGSYILELVASEECPSFEWISQLIGE